MPARHLILLVVVTVAGVAAWFARERDRRGQKINEVLAIVDAAYIEAVDDQSLVHAAIDGMVTKLDEHSAFVRGDDQRELEAALDQRFGGVGLEIGIDSRTGELTVTMPLTGGPAWQAGIVAGDRIKAIDGEATAGMPIRDAVAMLRGTPGQAVTLTVMPAGDTGAEAAMRDVTLTRDVVEIDSVEGDHRRPDGSWDWWLEGEPGVALIRITGFGERTALELDAALSQIVAGYAPAAGRLVPLRGIVIDLRGNPGGLVTSAVDVCDRFLDAGVIVSTRGRKAAGEIVADADPTDVRRASSGAMAVGVPIVVIVDGLTASAAEIVAACLQDHGRATVVGERTFGKGTVQSILPLSSGGLLKLTTSEYLRPSGMTINRRPDDAEEVGWGVSPDPGFVIVPSGDSLERLARWRRTRDARMSADAPDSGLVPPKAVDEVLSRALDALRIHSGLDAKLGSEEETARDAHEATPAGA